MISVIDYGVGNIGSILNMLRKIGAPGTAVSDPQAIAEASKLILPGVGAFDAGMEALNNTGAGPALLSAVENGTPVLGICLGMQLMTQGSEEGRMPGLGLVSGHCARFELRDKGLRVPHMGWNVATPKADAQLFDPDEPEHRFYFVHTYHVICDEAEDVAATTEYGHDFTCALARGTLFGVQFHPEKSHRFGMELLRRYAEV
ncbi:MAG: imidazole glycerol phosphate synthase subunit HisH [Paracoccaceae bacterium]